MIGLRERKKRAARQAIRTAAWRLFAQNGFEPVSVRQIADAANVSRTTFFNYYASKEAVVSGPDERVLEAASARCRHVPADLTAWDALAWVVLGVLEDNRDTLAGQRSLKARDPLLSELVDQANGSALAALRDWVEGRGDEDRHASLLQLNLAIAASNTAYQLWNPDDSVDQLTALVRSHLRTVGRAFE